MVNAARIGGSVPFYLHSLSLLGQYLNRQRAARPVIAEVDTGFLLMYFAHNHWTKPISMDLHHADLLEVGGELAGSIGGKDGLLIKGGDQRDKKHPVCPMGYDVFLRAVGDRIDRRGGVGVTICDTGDRIYVGYWVDKATFLIRDGRRQPISTAQLEVYDAAAAKKLLDTTDEHRAQEMRRYQQGLRLNPHDHISMLAAAFLLESEGHYREAEVLVQRVAAAVPEHPEAHYHVARLALLRGDKRQALAAAKKAASLQADDAAVHDLYGRVQLQLHRKKEAIAAFETAVSLQGEHGLYHYHLAKAYEAVGQTEAAAVEMALSSPRIAVPVMELVQEDITIDDGTARAPEPLGPAPMSLSDALPAESALLPQIPDTPPVERSMPVPTMTTTFEPEASAWPTASAQSAAMRAAPAQAPPVAHAYAPQSDASSPFQTLEQRLHQARQAPVRAASQPVEALPPDLAALGEYHTPQQGNESTPPAAIPMVAAPVHPAPAPPVAEPPPSTAIPAAPAAPPSARPPVVRTEQSSADAVELAAEIMTVQHALGTEPNRADLHRKLGFLLARQGKTAEAATEFRKALQASRTSL